jgi:hypothetical protein
MIRRAPVASLTAVLLLATPARADSMLDKPAPDPAVTKWVVGEAPPSFKALKGRCALLELTDPADLVCQGLESRTAEIAKRGASKQLLVVSVAVGEGADEEKAKEFAKQFKVTWPFGVDRKFETLSAAGMPSLPRHFLVAPDGRVLWEGSPGALDDATLDGFLDRARLWRSEEVAKAMRPAADFFVKGKHAAAVKKVQEALAEVERRKKADLPLEGTEERDGRVIVDAVSSMAAIRLLLAERLAKDRWTLEAEEAWEAVAASFAGTEWEAKAREALAVSAKDERGQAEVAAAKRLREILSKTHPLTRKSVQRAIEQIDVFVEGLGSLITADRARAEKQRLQKLLDGM